MSAECAENPTPGQTFVNVDGVTLGISGDKITVYFTDAVSPSLHMTGLDAEKSISFARSAELPSWTSRGGSVVKRAAATVVNSPIVQGAVGGLAVVTLLTGGVYLAYWWLNRDQPEVRLPTDFE